MEDIIWLLQSLKKAEVAWMKGVSLFFQYGRGQHPEMCFPSMQISSTVIRLQ